ncbi:TorD/DmsD family molecular chaperone [Campylobacter geochelonis]|uniref:Ubiquinol cytochrome C oxidoreductase, Rieske 2Fe-2S subunit n=1 Tax=Campylobacter geochelonis TaxID=1780362 RepID=A0A128EHH4_9BACT|nr:molecular chaperone TorD family protein [Campylobacter geochelonis]QKF71395.1 Nitrate_red_del domain-containing protein [Campylobacter geochelonis]CZE47728.1 ubiquinol cytochrome C oxidoreductase%2C Rieske 2Fe-2S subunit [Campylobacter geochelonis]CZE48429.1 ubiquinol cytochrome C oxidoreductase%2C Rieske 2Fe-2S subunit [Campylobacter geochelonis]CZE50904.1 ubiquinol cytochrome C oxidoreductase%2C Rieske 2Fe-2S subunit [Campylobacter geochelonis]
MRNLDYETDISNTYDFLRELFFNELKHDSFEKVKIKALNLSLNLQSVDFVRHLLNDINLDEARWEYNRLFIGPKKPPASPFESVYRSKKGLLMREFAYEVREIYANVGLEVQAKDHMPDDFLGFELQYLFYISSLARESLKNEKFSQADELIELRKEFLKEHILVWIYKFIDDIKTHSKEKIWVEFGEFLTSVFELEKKHLGL